ncbi:phosphoribosylformylglycinamidine synthase II [candidate division WOR-1 bacterium RIFOXYB2_FULL_42_35]|uniref:Phosphoribosylformylglycinamidine synthase subunit PurL n=1 Tax=candidate division WOR-1 bacterium RIFOXYC2_FULL_41_25 TaxID=1802586 RepID=A0A1F4TN58_UNCSA|nr:MAG: phosphoribosylformylglycinamidine synthase II [candidate division WOR-1 bacterium RIFOXYA2_FULL_41_14]OGC24307.1 MAG: phosphoribosylformylglycinamidine synthase II [candidate division WOR-1 bacterium RIFOXYB2_FULL_42_35]OGC34009.1 MAG: phosphoribosylformylglycinamidine synthase II [candidate division WOR-1 bacterium RIFOXYC2_FULL_41_25]OGC43123.1 MAG: phosphoribosylformylglycinamidine synthase II [candidate division WOR-1 bacterium RIFOXYD2_FULL_41_8]
MVKPEVYKELGLTDQEYQKIETIMDREPSPTELAMFSVEWSEHCGYPRSRKWLKLFPQEGKYPSLVGEDSGGIIVDDLAIVFKMESHNHPSQVEPKQGAATGVGGIIRDIFTAGAKPIASLNSLRFGPLTEPYNKFLLRGVVDGIQFYGNCLGVPTVGGEIYFDESYSGNCLVNAMSIGVCHKDQLARAKAVGVGNPIMYVGSSTGRDGIGGCSVLASHEFSEGEEKRPTVQIGDPFTEKCLIEATLEMLATGHVLGIKDMGAAGLTCSSAEMADAGGVGMEINLDDVPLREQGMEAYEIMMSESQERMLVCVKAGHEKEIEDIFAKWDLHGVVIGYVTDDKNLRVKYQGKVVADIKTEALAKGPVYDMPAEKPAYLDEVNKLDLATIPLPTNYNEVLLSLLASPSLANKAWVYEQYDHMVQTNTVVLPGSDAAVLRLKGTTKGLAATTDCNSRYCYLNPYRGAQIAVAEAARNLVCSGADPAAVTDCLNFGNPEKPDRFWYFKNCVMGIVDACRELYLPVVSGNVSFYNESPKGPINPTPSIGMIGILNDVNKHCTQYFKDEGDIIFLLGESKEELGGSEYLKVIHGQVAGEAPALGLKVEKAVQKVVYEAIGLGYINAAHDCSEGGLAVALAECCMSDQNNMIGAKITLVPGIRADAALFGESQSRIIVTCKKENLCKIEELAIENNLVCNELGVVGGDNLEIANLINLPVEQLSQTWRSAIKL